jgi:class 3 adenylate cyclase
VRRSTYAEACEKEGSAIVITDGSVERRLAAILAGDVVGYSRLIGEDEVGTLGALKAVRRELTDPAIAAHHGRIVKTTGDGILVEFASVVDAIEVIMLSALLRAFAWQASGNDHAPPRRLPRGRCSAYPALGEHNSWKTT